MAGNSNKSFIQLPSDVSEPVQLRRFLDKLVQELDVAFSNRGTGGFASSTVITSLNGLIQAFLLFQAEVEAGDIIVNVTTDTVLENKTQIVLVNTSTENVIVNLPSASSAYSNNRSKAIAVTKTSSDSNTVTIGTLDGALVVGETTQQLLYDGEVLNFITDGSNWYLGA